MAPRRSKLGQVLLESAREHDWTAPSERLAALIGAGLDVERLIGAAAWHRIDGCVWLSLRSVAMRERIRPGQAASLGALEKRYLSAAAVHLKVLSDLRLIGDLLDRASIEYAVVKGPVLAELAYTRPDLRSYLDLDILVAPEALGPALEQLEGVGAVVLDRNWTMLTECRAGEVKLQMESGTIVDLHWTLFNELPIRQAFPVQTATLLSRVQRTEVGGATVSVLEPTDALVHVAVHACAAGGNKLGWLKDVEQSLAHRFEGWPALVDRAQEWRAGLPVATLLVRTSEALGTDVSSDVLRQLAPPSWLAFIAAADRVSPVTRTPADGSLSRLAARSARTTTRSSLVECFRRSSARVVSQARRTGHPPIWDPTDKRSAAFPDGERATFLAEVGRQR